jgi:hypothetical protein
MCTPPPPPPPPPPSRGRRHRPLCLPDPSVPSMSKRCRPESGSPLLRDAGLPPDTALYLGPADSGCHGCAVCLTRSASSLERSHLLALHRCVKPVYDRLGRDLSSSRLLPRPCVVISTIDCRVPPPRPAAAAGPGIPRGADPAFPQNPESRIPQIPRRPKSFGIPGFRDSARLASWGLASCGRRADVSFS